MKHLFLLDPNVIYLNHGSYGACPREVLEASQAWQLEMERNPVAFLGRRSAALLAEARRTLGGCLGARGEDLVFLPNTTHGVNTVARSLNLQPGDQVLTTDHEYGACDAAWAFACKRHGAEYLAAEIPLPFQAEAFTDRVWRAVTPRTRVLFLSHITSGTALILPVAELCRRARERGILTVVDGAHAPGQIPLELDALGADFYLGNCHKWLCAPKGAAFLHARAERHPMLDAPVVSWGYLGEALGLAELDAFTGTSLLERRLQWQGTRDLSAFLSVPAAIAFQARHGWDQVRRDCHALAAETVRRICALTGLEPIAAEADFGQMAAIPVPAMDHARLKSELFEKYRIEIPVTGHKGKMFLRVSFQGYNTRADADALVEGLRGIYGLRA